MQTELHNIGANNVTNQHMPLLAQKTLGTVNPSH